MVPIGGSVLALAQTSDPSSKVIVFTWLAPDGTTAAVNRIETSATDAQSVEFFPNVDGLWSVQANFTDGANILATAVQTFQVVQPIPYTLSLQTTWANATGGFKINSSATNGINIEVPSSSASTGTPVKITSFIFLNTPPGRNFTAQLGAVPEEYGQITLNATGIGGMMLVSLTHQALNQSSSIYYYSNSSQQWIQASNVTFVPSANPFGSGTIKCYIPISELAGTTIAIVNGPVIPEFSSASLFAALTLVVTAVALVFQRKIRKHTLERKLS